MKRFFRSLVIKETQIKATTKLKRLPIPSVGNHMEELELTHTAHMCMCAKLLQSYPTL